MNLPPVKLTKRNLFTSTFEAVIPPIKSGIRHKVFTMCMYFEYDYIYRPQKKFVKVMFSQVSVCPGGGLCVMGACVVGGCYGSGAYMAGVVGGMCGGGHSWQGGLAWQERRPLHWEAGSISYWNTFLLLLYILFDVKWNLSK